QQPWRRIATGAPPYELWEVLAALQACRRETGRRPSCRLYTRWSAEKRKQTRRAGRHGRIPCQNVMYAFFPASQGGWNAALAVSQAAEEEALPRLRSHRRGSRYAPAVEQRARRDTHQRFRVGAFPQ